MASDRLKLVALLGCIALLAACPDDAPKDDPSDPDAGELEPDAGSEPPDPRDEPEDPREDPRDEPKPAPAKPAAGGGVKPGNPPARPSSPNEPPAAPSNDGGAPPEPAEPSAPAADGDARFFLPTPGSRNSAFPRLEIDRNGGVHAAYPAAAGSGAFYSYCPNECKDPSQMKVVELPTDAIPGSALIAVTPDGRPRVLIPTYLHVYYAECDRGCTDAANWTTTMIIDHQANQDVTGDTLALDSQGRPRFLMHTYVAYLGVGQKEPHTYYVQCDSSCTNPASWSVDSIQDQMWTYSTLRFDANDRAHLSTVAISPSSSVKKVAYLRCDSGCANAEAWSGIYLADAFENSVASVVPSVSMALTKSAGPRVVALVMPEPGARSLMYFECDQDCVNDNWSYVIMSEAYQLGSGVDLALDAKDRPRFVYTIDYNIGLYHCDSVQCTAGSSNWTLEKVEFASDLETDTTILWPNCSYATWQLHDPTIVLTANGSARVGYEASDMSGGWTTLDQTKPPCLAGKDMTLARMALMPAF